ncbi:U3 small nucleolar RNA-associated protein 6-domain-containing protein [Phellopilus nigrolimitatus]|nr:U3 small nucleolar RNA-associated protein 6-domain-containing protein [Phellopilus nigrolimitatus]
MERVQFQQEQMLAELKDLVQKGVFSQVEIKQIMKKRTAFETSLIRRIPKKGDFLRYAAYEMSLEALRRKRIERLELPKGPPTISDFALVRRQFQIFERALKKFKDDVGLWVQYIQAAQRAQARALVSRICGRALQLHPNVPSLYVLAAAHELKHLSHAAARVLLQRGIRMNNENVDLWREYVKMEMGFVEALRRRWGVLGLKVAEEAREDVVERDVEMSGLEGAKAGLVSSEGMDEDDEKARMDILNGALVKTVISNAVKAVPTPELFNSIHTVLTTYPCPPSLRRSLLDDLHALLHLTLLSPPSYSSTSKSDSRTNAQAAKLYAMRFLTPELEGEALADALRRANEDLLDIARVRGSEEMASVYAQFVQEWFEKRLDDHLNLYLLTSLQSLCSSSRSPSLLATHLRLLQSPHNSNPPSASKLFKLAKKYAKKSPQAVDVWLFLLELESASEKDGEDTDWKKLWAEARKQFPVGVGEGPLSDSRRDEVWFWGLDHQTSRPLKEQISTLEVIFLQVFRLISYALLCYRHCSRKHAPSLRVCSPRSSLCAISTFYISAQSQFRIRGASRARTLSVSPYFTYRVRMSGPPRSTFMHKVSIRILFTISALLRRAKQPCRRSSKSGVWFLRRHRVWRR